MKGLYALTADNIKNAHMTKFNVNLMNISNYTVDPNMALCEDIAKDLLPLIVGMFTKIFNYHAEKDTDRSIASSLKEFLGQLKVTYNNKDL